MKYITIALAKGRLAKQTLALLEQTGITLSLIHIYRVSNKLKSCISFKQHNLLKDGYPQRVHLIVCRNVMIYFTEEAKERIYRRFSDSLCKQGILFVGSTEQIIGAKKYNFQGIQSFFYEKQ